MTTGLLILIGVVIGIPIGFGLYASIDDRRIKSEEWSPEQWSEYHEGQQ